MQFGKLHWYGLYTEELYARLNGLAGKFSIHGVKLDIVRACVIFFEIHNRTDLVKVGSTYLDPPFRILKKLDARCMASSGTPPAAAAAGELLLLLTTARLRVAPRPHAAPFWSPSTMLFLAFNP